MNAPANREFCIVLPDTSPRNQWGFAPSRRDVAIPALSGEEARTVAERAEPCDGRRGSHRGSARRDSGVAGLRFVLAGPPPPQCDVPRGPRSATRCELPPGHGPHHVGRSPSGRWFSWSEKGDTA
jgi:hypothetical protein